jgi:methylglutaconyl-CoA hydratase
MNREFIITNATHHTGHIVLNRPEVHNAMHIGMIREISEAIRDYNKRDDIRIIMISANGPNFSAGADLEWMRKGLDQQKEELYRESRELAMLFNDIYNSPRITVAMATGKVMGGANGIMAAADIPLATPGASFAFSEVKLGLIPATIAPYIVQRAGTSAAYEWMLSGRPIAAEEAMQKGLISRIVTEEEAKQPEKILEPLLRNGPEAMKGVKRMFREGNMHKHPDQLIDSTAQLIAEFRVSEEGQEGIRAFFEKRQPHWTNE